MGVVEGLRERVSGTMQGLWIVAGRCSGEHVAQYQLWYCAMGVGLANAVLVWPEA